MIPFKCHLRSKYSVSDEGGKKQTPKQFCNLLFIPKTPWSLGVSIPFNIKTKSVIRVTKSKKRILPLLPRHGGRSWTYFFSSPHVRGFSNRAQTFTTPYCLDVDSPFQPVHNNSTSSLGQTSASHFASTIALVLANLGPLVLASSLMRSRAPSFMKSRASESVETRAHRSCVYRQCILVSNLQPGAALQTLSLLFD